MLLAVLPLLSLPVPTRSSISRIRVEVVVLLLCTPSRAGVVFALAAEGLGDGLSPRGTVSIRGRGAGDDLELSPPLEDVEPVLSRDRGGSLEPDGLTAFLLYPGDSLELLGLGRLARSKDPVRSRWAGSGCLRLADVEVAAPPLGEGPRLLSPLKTPAGSRGEVFFGSDTCNVFEESLRWFDAPLILSFTIAGSEVVEEPEDGLANTAGSDILSGALAFTRCVSAPGDMSRGGIDARNSSYICKTSISSGIGASEYSENGLLVLRGPELDILEAGSLVGACPVASASNICAWDIALVPLIRFNFGVRRFSAGGVIFSGAGTVGVGSGTFLGGGVGACRGVSKRDRRKSSSCIGRCEAGGGVFGRRGID